MSQIIVSEYSTFFSQAMEEISAELLEAKFVEFKSDKEELFAEQKKIDVIVGMTGDYKGRLLLETSFLTAQIITQTMNYGPLEEEGELYMYMGEFVNMLAGRAITYINNLNQDRIVRLTPPAIFAGEDLEITTPNIEYKNMYFKRNKIQVKLNIGFEGV
ncbi:MAG: chemotaxis protein CheX [Halanaerobiales bacterium]